MTCKHLIALEKAIIDAGIKEVSRGKPWSKNCREWVYFACVLDRIETRQAFELAECVKDHQHLGTHDGQEAGFVCEIHHDAILGRHPDMNPSVPTFQP